MNRSSTASRRLAAVVSIAALVASLLVVAAITPAEATPAASSAETAAAFGRVFPDPHGCIPARDPDEEPARQG